MMGCRLCQSRRNPFRMPGFTTAGGRNTTATTYQHSSMTCSPKWTRRPEDMTVAGGRRMTLGHTLIKRAQLAGLRRRNSAVVDLPCATRVESLKIYKVCPEVTGHD